MRTAEYKIAHVASVGHATAHLILNVPVGYGKVIDVPSAARFAREVTVTVVTLALAFAVHIVLNLLRPARAPHRNSAHAVSSGYSKSRYVALHLHR